MISEAPHSAISSIANEPFSVISEPSAIFEQQEPVKLTQPNAFQALSSTQSDNFNPIEIKPLQKLTLGAQTEQQLKKIVQTQLNDDILKKQVKHRAVGELGRRLESALLNCPQLDERVVISGKRIKGFFEYETERGRIVSKTEVAVGQNVRIRGVVGLGGGYEFAAEVL